MPQTKYIQWECKCHTSYGLEPHLAKPHNCTKIVNRQTEKKCDNPFPDQEQRNKMYQEQYGVVLTEE
jgi:hypothetical protein